MPEPLEIEELWALPAVPEPYAPRAVRARHALRRSLGSPEPMWRAVVLAVAVSACGIGAGAALVYAAGQIAKVVGA